MRDETTRLGFAADNAVVSMPLDAPLCDIERAWIHICQQHDARRRWQWNGNSIDLDCLAHLVRGGLDRILESGAIGAAHIAVLALFGELGYPPNINCPVAYELWTDGMKALDAAIDLHSVEFL